MTRDTDIERVLERWFAEGPSRMPDRLFDVLVDRIDRVPQRRLAGLLTRINTMPATLRLTAIAATVVIAIGAIGAVALIGQPGPNVGGPPNPSPSIAPSPSVPPIADGLYVHAPLQVADLKTMINGDAKLTAAEKKWLIDTAFGMKDGTRFGISLEFSRGRLTERQTVDAKVGIGTEGTYSFADGQTLVFQERCSCPPQRFTVMSSGDSFRLQLLNPPTAEVDLLPAKVLFESGPFTRQP